jgi:hypothetical protein
MGEIILYVDGQFGGLHTHMFRTTLDFTRVALIGAPFNEDQTWNDKVSSFKVVSGVWNLYRDINGDGLMGQFGPGEFAVLPNGVDNDALSGVELVEETPRSGRNLWWMHGNVTELEGASNITKTPRGWGAEFSFPPSAASDTSAWLHVSVPTPLFSNDITMLVYGFSLNVDCDPNLGFIDTIRLYAQRVVVQEFDNLTLATGSFGFGVTSPYRAEVGLSVSFHFVCKRGTGPDPTLLTVYGAGLDAASAP